MAASDIPPTNLLLRIPGVAGDQLRGACNVQSFRWTLQREPNGAGINKRYVELSRLGDIASPTIAMAFALGRTLGREVVLAVIDADGADIATWTLKDPMVTAIASTAAIGGNERPLEKSVLAPSQLTFLHVRSNRSAVI